MATQPRSEPRRYQETHAHLTFGVNLRECSQLFWTHVGEAESKCQHIAFVPLMPEQQIDLYNLYLSKGVAATTNIEGGTLSEEDVRDLMQGRNLGVASMEMQEREATNVIDACNLILQDVREGRSLEVTPERIRTFNQLVLRDLELPDDVRPGEFRTHSVVVGPYRAAPAEDVAYLTEELCEWLQREWIPEGPHSRFAEALIKAVLAHLYLAWIHPFGDGNGRTARLIEFQILVGCGLVPVPGGHLMSNHYNKTRPTYYSKLDRARHPGGVAEFLYYAVHGFCEGLREQLGVVRDHQWRTIWENYVHLRFRDLPETTASHRRKHVVLDVPPDTSVAKHEIPEISTRVAAAYALAGSRTLARDLNELVSLGLLIREGTRYRSNRDQLLPQWLPPRAAIPQR